MAPLPTLSRSLLESPGFAERTDLVVPPLADLDLPERAVQFGTGALLRGLVDVIVDDANRAGSFGGRIVAVGSTGSGRDERINDQNGLYTVVARGVVNGRRREEIRIVSALSRAISAQSHWDEVLACARNPELRLVVSNTTEIGIALDEGDTPGTSPPRSFPGKLTRFLYERARVFDFSADGGVVVLPCELIEDNGARLREIVLALASRWGLAPEFARWIEEAVPFCNTLVDRIVPGMPGNDAAAELFGRIGYRDDMLTSCESYRLFAIEGDDSLRDRLGIAGVDGVIVAPDIAPYRERKVRLLNGTHSITAPVALLAGCETVREAVEDDLVGRFVRRVLRDELLPTTDAPDGEEFAREVLDRFANPDIHHALADITLQATMKMRVRVVPAIERFAERMGRTPALLAFGFAAHLLYLRGDLHERWRGERRRVPLDDQGARIRALWAAAPADVGDIARTACADAALWGTVLSRIPGFAETAADQLTQMTRSGVPVALDALLAVAAE